MLDALRLRSTHPHPIQFQSWPAGWHSPLIKSREITPKKIMEPTSKLKHYPIRATTKDTPKLRAVISLLFIGLTLLVCGSLGSFQAYMQDRLLRTSGTQTQANVISRRYVEGEDEDNYYITYAYQAPSLNGNGMQSFTYEQEVNKKRYQSVEKGGNITIIYAATEPSTSKIAGTGSSFRPFFLTLLLAGLVILFWVGIEIRKYLRAVNLNRKGKLIRGKLLDAWIEDKTDEVGFYIAYQIGNIQVAQEVTWDEYENLPVGEPLTVRYLPDDPTCSKVEL